MCGIYGFINNGTKPFRYDIFTVLGIANDRRGGDSCGVFIDGQVEYGIGQKALFENFFWDSELLNNTVECQVALGHDRKASVGGITVEKAHPILIKNDEGKVDFVLVHNGTIYNYESLAKEYIPDIDVSKLSDSQVLALILYHKGFDVLEKYNGGTAFAAVDYRNGTPEAYLFKGASKAYSTAKSEVERPLYLSVNDGDLYFSSIPSYLCALLNSQVFELKDNKIYKFVNGKLYVVRTINRDNCQQNRLYNCNTVKGYYDQTINNFNYLRFKENYNVYTDDNGNLLHGKYKVSQYGRIFTEKDKNLNNWVKLYTIFFFNGIPFRDKFSFNTIKKAVKKSGLSAEEYITRNETVVRYQSCSPVFFDKGIAYKVTSLYGHVPFSGVLLIFGRSSGQLYRNGRYVRCDYEPDYTASFEEAGLV